jgi:hypothetical protein
VVITEPAHTALQAYARQRDDRDLEVWTAEIKLRASVRIGELVRELDKAPNQHARPANGTGKREAIRDAGLSKSTANRYEGLAGPRDLQAAGKAAAPRRARLMPLHCHSAMVLVPRQ